MSRVDTSRQIISLGSKSVFLFGHQKPENENNSLPKGFAPPFQSHDYLQGTFYKNSSHTLLLERNKPLGIRRTLGRVAMDLYTCQEEPILEPFHGFRMVVWQPIHPLERPAGWLPWPAPTQPKTHAVAEVLQGDYWIPWSTHAKRHRKKWLARTDLVIEEISFEEFANAFEASGKLPRARAGAIEAIRRRMEHANHHVFFFGAHDSKGCVVAALAVCDLKDIFLSVHLAAFIHPDFEKTSVGTGLIDAWYARCQKTNIRFAYFDIVWSPGDPKGWRGYSQFKKQFRPHLLTTPLPFVKFTIG